MAPFERILRRARLLTSKVVDIGLSGGEVSALAPDLPSEGTEVWDLAGRLVLPGFVDAHVHLDKTLSLGRKGLENHTGTLQEAIERWGSVGGSLSREDYLTRALRAVNLAVCCGTTVMRTHVDVDEGLTALEAVLELKDQVRDRLTLQVVALGHAGLSREGDALMRGALDAGADCVGGAPALTPDPAAAVRAALDLAEAYGKPADLHIDEADDPVVRTLETLADEVMARGLRGRVTAGHLISLGAMACEEAEPIVEKVAEAGIKVVTLPSVNLVLRGRGDTARVRRGLTRVKELLRAGVCVAAASDNVQDPFNPFGNYDLVWIANLAAHAAHLTGARERRAVWELVTAHPASVLGLRGYGLEPGCSADLVVLDHEGPDTALAALPPRYAVFKAGVPVHAPHARPQATPGPSRRNP